MSEKKDNRPSHRAFQVIKISKDKGKWREIGAGWLHTDMAGMTVKLDAMPVNGEVILRAIDWDAGEEAEPELADGQAAELAKYAAETPAE